MPAFNSSKLTLIITISINLGSYFFLQKLNFLLGNFYSIGISLLFLFNTFLVLNYLRNQKNLKISYAPLLYLLLGGIFYYIHIFDPLKSLMTAELTQMQAFYIQTIPSLLSLILYSIGYISFGVKLRKISYKTPGLLWILFIIIKTIVQEINFIFSPDYLFILDCFFSTSPFLLILYIYFYDTKTTPSAN